MPDVGGANEGTIRALRLRFASRRGPPLHIHERENEIFYFFEGTFEVQIGEEIIRPQPGTLAFIPTGVPHTYRNVGDHLAKAFFMLTPADELGKFFEAADQLPPQDPPDVEALVALGTKYGLQIVGPPLGAPE